MSEQSFSLLYRSATRNNDASLVRPDGVDILIQQDYSFTDRDSFDYIEPPKIFTGKLRTKDLDRIIRREVEDDDRDRFYDKATVNSRIPFDMTEPIETWVSNNASGLFESYILKSNHEERRGFSTLEDGRSRRYKVRSSLSSGCIVSHDISGSGELIKFGYVSDSKGFITNSTSMIRWCMRTRGVVPIGITILHGHNPSWLEYKQKTNVKIDDMKDAIKNFMLLAAKAARELKRWADMNQGLYIVILCKDHRLRFPHFNYIDFFKKYGKEWHLPSPRASINDAHADAQWWETHGYVCSPEIEGDICIHHVDDHNPILFTFKWIGTNMKPSVKRKIMSEYLLIDKTLSSTTFKGYIGEDDAAINVELLDAGL